MPHLWLELEVINIGLVGTLSRYWRLLLRLCETVSDEFLDDVGWFEAGEELIGRVRIPVTKKDFLTSPKAREGHPGGSENAENQPPPSVKALEETPRMTLRSILRSSKVC